MSQSHMQFLSAPGAERRGEVGAPRSRLPNELPPARSVLSRDAYVMNERHSIGKAPPHPTSPPLRGGEEEGGVARRYPVLTSASGRCTSHSRYHAARRSARLRRPGLPCRTAP